MACQFAKLHPKGVNLQDNANKGLSNVNNQQNHMETAQQNQTENKQNNPQNESPVKQWAPLVILLVAAAIVGWQLGQPDDKKTELTGTTTEQTANTTEIPTGTISNPASATPTAVVGNMRFEGTLLPSPDIKRGNVVVKTGTSEIYLWTSRDIQDLVNKQVVVEAQGTMQGFKVLDIKITESK